MKFAGCRNLLNDWTPRVGGKHLLWCPINYCFIIKGFLSLFVLISVGIIIRLPYPGPNIWPSALSSRPSGSAHVHQISADLKHVGWFTCSLFLWMHLLWNKLDGRKIQFCIANVISISLRTLNVEFGTVYMGWDISPKWDVTLRDTFHPALTWEKYPTCVRYFLYQLASMPIFK